MLEFGTAGIRGVLGHLPNQLNENHVKRVIFGYAKYLLKQFPDVRQQGIVIARDNRQKSLQFANISARILANFGIKVFIFKDICPTPIVSFAIKQLKACGGIMITASHNPAEYNGIKIYNKLGFQILPDQVAKITNFFENYQKFTTKNISSKALPFSRKIVKVDYLIDNYINQLLELIPFKSSQSQNYIYSPLHGTGGQVVKKIAQKIKLNLKFVEKQMAKSTKFHFASSPNPEDKKAFELMQKQMEEENLQYGFVSDPDSDRLGIVEKKGNQFYYFNGNEMATLIVDFLIKQNYLNNNSQLITSFVSSSLPTLIAKSIGCQTEIIPTGFKWVADKILSKPNSTSFAFEESYGSMIFPQLSLDKDALQIIVFFWKMLSEKPISLVEQLEKIYEKYGFPTSVVHSLTFNDEQFSHLNEYLEQFSKLKFDYPIAQIIDYRLGFEDIHPENMIKIIFENNSWVAMRPSGTEPKLKIYVFSIDVDKNQSKIINQSILTKVKSIFKNE